MVAILGCIPNNVGLIKFYHINNKRHNKLKKKKTSEEYSDASL